MGTSVGTDTRCALTQVPPPPTTLCCALPMAGAFALGVDISIRSSTYRSYIMGAITLSIRQFFNALTVLFAAGEKVAKSLDNLATVAEETSGQYVDDSRAQRAIKRIELEKQLKLVEAK